MAERKSRVFLVATSNDISKLPPELLRKGRMDELFFVDLPGEEAREKILNIHLQKRQLDPDSFDTNLLVEATEDFTGAEIEQAVVSAAYNGFADKTQVSQQLLLDEIESTTPLSVIKAEQIAQLRHWAEERQLTKV